MSVVLVVRPLAAAEALVSRLRADGIAALPAPVSDYIDLPFDAPDFSGFDALAFTSAEAARALARRGISSDMPVYCTGERTAEAALAAGFPGAVSAGGDGGDLVRAVAGAGARRVLYLSGLEVARDLAGELAGELAGASCVRLPVYAARLLDELPPEAMNAIDRGEVRAALLFSARGAARFASLVRPEAAGGMEILCLSARVALGAGERAWRAVRVAETPDTAALLRLLA